jgi:folate-dependent phosphoribosylglycinamide formyltransferase PurN
MDEVFSPLRVAVLTSLSAPGLDKLITHPNRGALYDLVAVVSTETSLADTASLEAAQIPLILRPFRRYISDRNLPLRNLRAREEYDSETADLLHHFRIDYVFLVGYNYIVSEPLVESFSKRVLAIHDGDLMLRDDNGRRRYAGLHAVREAVLAGETETRSSAYFITQEVGAGPLFLLSKPYRIAQLACDARNWGAADLVCEYADLHRRWMVRDSWGEMLVRAIEFLAAGSVSVVRDMTWIDGVPGPCRMGEAPALCRERVQSIDSGIPASCPLIRD